MPVDSSIYFQQQPIDILGNVQKGMALGQNIQDRKVSAQDLKWKNEAQAVYGLGIKQNPDGSTTFDQNAAMAGMQKADPNNPYIGKMAYDMNQSAQQRAFEQEKYQNSLKQQEFDNKYRYDALASSAADRAEARNERRYQSGILRDEKMQALQTPYGMANTADDAKQLKGAHESKAAFDSKLQELINLRKEYGGEMFNREAVARGQQLSKDLLLEYKNMAKLGVLSKSDEDIINAIIPSDPLEYRSPLAAIQGQDPILSNLEKFKGDSDRDFVNRVNTRTRSGLMGKPSDPISTLRKTTSELSLSPSMTRQDSEAVTWARKNPNDPRAAEILKRNGIGG